MGIKALGGANVEGLPLSEAIKAGDFIFVSGMVAYGEGENIVPGGVGAETDKIVEDLTALLAEAGASLANVVKTNVFLTDAADFDAFNSAYAKHFGPVPPARIAVVAPLTIDAKVEMDFTAYIGE